MGHVPTWLDKIAKDYWRKHVGLIDLQPEQEAAFAVLCQEYSFYRQATEHRERAKHWDCWFKMARDFNLTPKTAKKKPEQVQNDLDDFLTRANEG